VALDRNAFIQNYLEEAAENLKDLEAKILILKRDPENTEELSYFLRVLHTLKGSSRMLKFQTMEKIAHGLEQVFKGLKEGRYPLNPQMVHLVLLSCEYLRDGLESIRKNKDDTLEVADLLGCYESAYANEPFDLEKIQKSRKTSPEVPQEKSEKTKAPIPYTEAGPTNTEINKETVRVKTQSIEDLLKEHNDLVIKQFQLKKEGESLKNLEETLEQILKNPDFKPGNALRLSLQQNLNQVRESEKRFFESFTLLERKAAQIQEGLLDLLMLPIDLILGPLAPMVEETASSLGKDIELKVSGQDLRLDRAILEHLRDPLIHLVRNALDHGIESPDIRLKKGKEAKGTVRILCSTDSGSFTLRIKDDGAGLNYEKIKAKALSLHPERQQELESLEEKALAELLFEPGFSTKDEVSELSGRGLGLDIVRYQIEAVKGKVSLSSIPDKGTEFLLKLPLSLAGVNGFFVQVGSNTYVLPGQYIKDVVLIKESDKITMLQKKLILYRDALIPIVNLGELLGLPNFKEPERMHGLVVEHLGETLALEVDQITQYISMIYKALPRRLARIKALQGFVFDENFDLIPILSIPELIIKSKRSGNLLGKKRFSLEKPEYKHILVVDDSFTTREIERSILEFEGYTVETAVDGIEALEILKRRTFHLIVSDINMPRMDGPTLVDNIKRDDRLKNIPLIIVSSERDAEKRTILKQLGIQSFIDKADFDRGNLAQEVGRLIKNN